jgi:tRNA-dihydrouridine synthase B
MITIHGRTRCQFYKGHADWRAIRAIKDAVRIPVIANGDIIDATTARQALSQSGADGVMIGRGAQGRPWALAEISSELYGTAKPTIPVGADLIAMVQNHYSAMLDFYGSDLGGRVARKHLGWYMDSAGTSTALRKGVLTARDPSDVQTLLARALDPAQNQEVAA